MDKKYSNIFWHQGVKIYSEELLKTEKGRIRIDHLENDVTKALINVFEYCNKKVLKAFLKLLNVNQAPDTFEFDFQVTDTNKYRQKPNRIMLSIISAFTSQSDASYYVKQSRPDACIFNKDYAILIESKTQSPLSPNQIKSHIEHYLGTATKQKNITWENITETFGLIKKSLPSNDHFLITQFCDFLELIGIAEFSGFSQSDFSMLGLLGKIPDEDYLDFKRMLYLKIKKFMQLLDTQIKSKLLFKNYKDKVAKVNIKDAASWSAFYFFDNDENIHVNKYPNINFHFNEHDIVLSLNAEIEPSVKRMITKIKKNPNRFNELSEELHDFSLTIYYKLQFLPMNNFVWKLIPGYPKEMGTFGADTIISSIHDFQNHWEDFKNTLLFEMKSGIQMHPKGTPFTKTELDFARKKNASPTYAIRIEKRYDRVDIVNMKQKIVPFFKKEILRLKDITEYVNT